MVRQVAKKLTDILGELWKIAAEGSEAAGKDSKDKEDWAVVMGEIEELEGRIEREGVR